eukprot:1325292-Ditylum_brightwellii.AAC.1
MIKACQKRYYCKGVSQQQQEHGQKRRKRTKSKKYYILLKSHPTQVESNKNNRQKQCNIPSTGPKKWQHENES